MKFDPRFKPNGDNSVQKQACMKFWRKLCKMMAEKGYQLQASDTGTNAEYLFPAGTRRDLTWLGKPKKSFRVANFWNWFANFENCLAPWNHIQCLNVDFGYTQPRKSARATRPKMGWAVAYTEDGYRYHTVFGWKFTREGGWEFVEPELTEELIDNLLNG